MYISRSQSRISIAVIFAAAIVALAVFLRTNTETTANIEAVNGEPVIVVTAPTRSAIPVSDSNGDGVPDWQEALVNTQTVDVATTNVESYNPDTLTEQFSQQFFEDVLRTKSTGAYGATPEEIIASAQEKLAQDAVDTLYTTADIKLSANNSAEFLASYGEAIAQILVNQEDTTEENEAVILQHAVDNQNPDELKKLDVKIAIYSAILSQTLALTAPTIAAKEHLDLINSYQAVLNDIKAMRTAFSDPMLALLRMKRYEDDVAGFKNAFENLYNKLYDNGARWTESSVVFNLISIQ